MFCWLVAIFLSSALCQDVRCTTAKGHFVIQVNPEWDGPAAERFLSLVDAEAFQNAVFHPHVLEGIAVQFVSLDLKESEMQRQTSASKSSTAPSQWRRGLVGIGSGGQVTIALADHKGDEEETIFAQVVEGIDLFDTLQTKYGSQPKAFLEETHSGIELLARFPDLDRISGCVRAPVHHVPQMHARRIHVQEEL